MSSPISTSLDDDQVYTAFAAGYLTPNDELADAPFDLVLAQNTAGIEAG